MLVPAIVVTEQCIERGSFSFPSTRPADEVISPGATRSGLIRPSSVGPNELNDATWSTRRRDTSAGLNVTTHGIAASSARCDERGTDAAGTRIESARSSPSFFGPILKNPVTSSLATSTPAAPAFCTLKILSEK